MAQQLSPLEQFLSNKLANEFRYVGNQLGKGNIPYAGKPRFSPEQMRRMTAPGLGTTPLPGSSRPLNGIETGKYGPTDWNPSANPSFAAPAANNAPAADRAYQQEKSRVAQLTAQNPELQRYEKARNVAKTQEEMNAVRDEGMRIWAAKNPGLAAKVKPGSTGYDAIQGVIGPATTSALNNEQVLGTQSFDPNTVLSTTQQIQGQYRPNQALTDQEILAAMSFDPNTAMRSAANIGFAPISPDEAGMLKAVGGDQGEYITPMSAPTSVNSLTQNKDIFQELLNRALTQRK